MSGRSPWFILDQMQSCFSGFVHRYRTEIEIGRAASAVYRNRRYQSRSPPRLHTLNPGKAHSAPFVRAQTSGRR